MTDHDPFAGYGGDRKRPWFGRGPFGYGWGPRTWQGWLVTAALVVVAFWVASVSNGDARIAALGLVPLVAVPLLIAWLQRR